MGALGQKRAEMILREPMFGGEQHLLICLSETWTPNWENFVLIRDSHDIFSSRRSNLQLLGALWICAVA